MLSNKWNTEDVVYNNVSFNNGVMCMFEDFHDGKVNKCIIDYALKNNKEATLLYNNSLYLNICNPQKRHKEQYETGYLF